jgi:hypothetical protein
MCNRARLSGEPETLFEQFSASWAQNVVQPNAFSHERVNSLRERPSCGRLSTPHKR